MLNEKSALLQKQLIRKHGVNNTAVISLVIKTSGEIVLRKDAFIELDALVKQQIRNSLEIQPRSLVKSNILQQVEVIQKRVRSTKASGTWVISKKIEIENTAPLKESHFKQSNRGNVCNGNKLNSTPSSKMMQNKIKSQKVKRNSDVC